MISFKTEQGRFNFRVAGLLFHDDKLLIHRLKADDFYALPGGRLEFDEDTESTLIREMKEELSIDVQVSRLLWVAEHFYTMHQEYFHEICFYYLMECSDPELLCKGPIFEVIEGERVFEFKWVPVDKIKDEEFYPVFIRNRVQNLPNTVERFVDRE